MINVIFHNHTTEDWEGSYGADRIFLPPGISSHTFSELLPETYFVFGPLGSGFGFGVSESWTEDRTLQVIYARVKGEQVEIVEKEFRPNITL